MTAALPEKRGGGVGGIPPVAPTHAFPERMPVLTSIRFWLALGVVLFHYQLNIVAEGGMGVSLIERARLAVDFFFILSGFVLSHVYGRQVRDGTFHYGRFLTARMARIYPAHGLMLVLMVVIVSVAVALGQPFDSQSYSFAGLVAAAGMIHAWLPASVPNEWNGPSWSLSAEWAAYLAFPVFAWIGLRSGRNPWLTLGLAIAGFVALDAFYRWRFGEILTHAELVLGVLRIAPEFLYGVALYQLGARLKLSPTVTRLAAGLSVVTLLAMMHFAADERLTVAVAGLVILTLALLARTDAAFAAHPWAVEAGEASYALYLVHLPLLIIWKNGMALLHGVDSTYRLPLWEAAVLLALTIGAAFALHAFWERPARLWLRWSIRKGADDRATIPPTSKEKS
ncbi:acyltransferase family protein [Brevundimonas mediterranea]|jgi:peptidoglycan/LPS O-acetylase OafA/YrhL|uniref:Acyltransferase n=1 Tax=Brevundimonas mediterranea TaxID=74329 RepID=A0AB37EB54_9CAUL|nr:acyltransferase [Brevundimonas mediterranea]QIH74321.1 acyltransferase [Brevundimonas mediterranea]